MPPGPNLVKNDPRGGCGGLVVLFQSLHELLAAFLTLVLLLAEPFLDHLQSGYELGKGTLFMRHGIS